MKQRNIRVRKNPPKNPPVPSRALIASPHWRSARPRDPARWRAVLLGTAAALCIIAPRAAEAGPQACVINGTEATCSGNQSGGIQDGVDFLAPPVTTLNINNLTQNIGSLSGGVADGNAINWTALGPINVISNTGNFIIDARNSGINVFSQGGNAVTVNHTGDIRTGDGAFVRAIDATSTGNATDSGAVSVTMTGNIFGGDGIRVLSRTGTGNAGAATIVYTGNNTGGLSAISDGDVNSGPVSITSNGNLGSSGGVGIFARSENDGTGTAGSATVSSTGNIVASLTGITATSEGGVSSAVSVTSAGNITANNGAGIQALSKAGNGLSAAATVTSTGNIIANGTGIEARSEATSGDSSGVTVTSTGNIVASLTGIEARSNAGNNGVGIVTVGPVTVTSTGNVAAGVNGIVAGSILAAGNSGNPGDIQVNINGGTVRGGTGAGLLIQGGSTSTLTVATGASLSSLSGQAIATEGISGTQIVNNSGVITGNVSLSGIGNNAFNNLAGGVFNAGETVFLRVGGIGDLTNAGTIAPGGVGTAPITTTLNNGNFVQAVGGIYAVDVAGATADRINVDGTASLAGIVLATARSLNITSSRQQFTILHADGGATNNGITLQGGDTLASKFELLFPNANDMVLQMTTNLTPLGVPLTPNQRVTAGHLQSALNAGGGSLGAVFGHLAGFIDGRAFAAALDRLHPEPYLAQVQSTWLASLSFADGLMSCPTAASADANAFIAEGQCTWMRMGARQLNVDRTSENIGFNDKTWGGSGGAQFALAPNWFGSIAFGYDNSTIKVDDRASMTGDIFHAGIGAKYVHGNWQIAGALTGGHASYNTTRFAVIPGVSADGDGSLNFLSGRMRVAYVFGGDAAYVKPLVDFDATGIRRSGIRETGAGPAGLNIHSQSDTLFSVAPAVEVGGEYAYGNALLRPFLRAGARFFSERDLKATASFIGSPDAAPAFTVTTPIDQWMGEAAAGIDILSADRYDARISYEGRFGERSTQHGGNVKLRAKF